MPRTLPPEVQLMIFRLAAPTVEFSPLLVAQKEVAAGRTFLSNLFLVHRNWTAWAQGQLSSFLSLWVGPQSRFVSLRGHFAWMKERGHRVQMLWLREEPWYRLNGAGYLRNELVDILEDVEEVVVRCGGGQLDFIHSMPNLRTLSLEGTADFHTQVPSTLTRLYLRRVLPNPLPSCFPRLTSLVLSDINFNCPFLVEFLTRTSALETLACASKGYYFADFLVNAPPTLRHLLVAVDGYQSPETVATAICALKHAPLSIKLLYSQNVDSDVAADSQAMVNLCAWCTGNGVQLDVGPPESTFDLAAWEP